MIFLFFVILCIAVALYRPTEEDKNLQKVIHENFDRIEEEYGLQKNTGSKSSYDRSGDCILGTITHDPTKYGIKID